MDTVTGKKQAGSPERVGYSSRWSGLPEVSCRFNSRILIVNCVYYSPPPTSYITKHLLLNHWKYISFKSNFAILCTQDRTDSMVWISIFYIFYFLMNYFLYCVEQHFDLPKRYKVKIISDWLNLTGVMFFPQIDICAFLLQTKKNFKFQNKFETN